MICKDCTKVMYTLEGHMAISEFCPLHASAGKLLEALESLMKEVTVDSSNGAQEAINAAKEKPHD